MLGRPTTSGLAQVMGRVTNTNKSGDETRGRALSPEQPHHRRRAERRPAGQEVKLWMDRRDPPSEPGDQGVEPQSRYKPPPRLLPSPSFEGAATASERLTALVRRSSRHPGSS
jgi:hypothetical protein